jgi:ribonucleoside-diphosphate reductase subunit M1
MRLPFESDEARLVNKEIFETIYFAALTASCDLAELNGRYESYPGCLVDQGFLQFDLWKVTPSERWDWNSLRAKIKTYGLRNSLLLAPMPTASTAQILGNNECFEPFTSNIYIRRVLSGEFPVVNKYLLEELISLGLWNADLRNELLQNNGSVQKIETIPHELKVLYKTVWEISQRKLIDMAADRGAFIDQSQSFNVFMTEPNNAKLSSMHFYGWKKGLKTGMYYLRTKSAAQTIKFTVDTSKKNTDKKEETVCNINGSTDGECLSCSA